VVTTSIGRSAALYTRRISSVAFKVMHKHRRSHVFESFGPNRSRVRSLFQKYFDVPIVKYKVTSPKISFMM